MSTRILTQLNQFITDMDTYEGHVGLALLSIVFNCICYFVVLEA